MAQSFLLPWLEQRFWGNDGKILANGRVYCYYAGTNDPAPWYNDPQSTSPAANPTNLDLSGQPANATKALYLSPSISYKIVVESADYVEQYTRNDVLITPNGDQFLLQVFTEDTDSVDFAGDGTATNPLTADVKVSAEANNIIEIKPDGIYAQIPSDYITSVQETASVQLAVALGVLTADVKRSTDAGNVLEIRPNGLFVPAVDYIKSVSNTDSVDLSVDGSGDLSADVKISAYAGASGNEQNKLSIRTDGLYAAPPAVTDFLDSLSIDVKASTSPAGKVTFDTLDWAQYSVSATDPNWDSSNGIAWICRATSFQANGAFFLSGVLSSVNGSQMPWCFAINFQNNQRYTYLNLSQKDFDPLSGIFTEFYPVLATLDFAGQNYLSIGLKVKYVPTLVPAQSFNFLNCVIKWQGYRVGGDLHASFPAITTAPTAIVSQYNKSDVTLYNESSLEFIGYNQIGIVYVGNATTASATFSLDKLQLVAMVMDTEFDNPVYGINSRRTQLITLTNVSTNCAGKFSASVPYATIYVSNGVDDGTPTQIFSKNGSLTPAERLIYLPICIATSADLTTITGITWNTQYINSAPKMLKDLLDVVGNPKTGLSLSGSGSNLHLNIGNGSIYGVGINADEIRYYTQQNDTAIFDAIASAQFYLATIGGVAGSASQDIPVTQYNTTGTTLATIPTNNWVNHRVFGVKDNLSPNANDLLVVLQYGQATYANSNAAIAAISTETFTLNQATAMMTFLGVVTIKQGSTLSNTAIFTQASHWGDLGGGGGGGGAFIGVADTSTIDMTDSAGIISADVVNNSISNVKLALMGGYTIKANPTNTSQTPIDFVVNPLSVVGRTASGVDISNITANNDFEVLRRSGTDIGFGQVATGGIADAAVTLAKLASNSVDSSKIVDGSIATAELANNAVTFAKMQTIAALSVLGNSLNATNVPVEITSTADAQVLRRIGTSLGFSTIVTASIADDAVTYAKLQNIVTAQRVLGSATANANASEISTATLLSWIGNTQGQILRRGASAWEALALGTNGQVLTSNGTDAVWATPAAQGVTSIVDTASVDLTLTSGTLSADVKISEQANNAISVISGANDGLFVQKALQTGFYFSPVGAFLQMNTEAGYGTGQRLYLIRQIASFPITLNKIRMAASVSGGGYDISIWKESGGTATRQALVTMTWGSAGFLTGTLSAGVPLAVEEVYYIGIWVNNSQAGSQNFLAGINLAAPQLSANYAILQRPVAQFTTGATHPTSVTLSSGVVPASFFMPWMELIQ